LLNDDLDQNLEILQSNLSRKFSKESSNESEGNIDNDHIEHSYTTQCTMNNIDHIEKKNDDQGKKNENSNDKNHKSDTELCALLLPDQNIESKIDPSKKSNINDQIKQEKKHIHYTRFESQPEPKKQIQINLRNTQ